MIGIRTDKSIHLTSSKYTVKTKQKSTYFSVSLEVPQRSLKKFLSFMTSLRFLLMIGLNVLGNPAEIIFDGVAVKKNLLLTK